MSDNPGLPPPASVEHFLALDIRVGRVLSAHAHPSARKPAYVLRVDFGQQIGVKHSSAQLTHAYRPEDLVGRVVLGVVNFPPRRVGGVVSEVLVLGVYSEGGAGPVVLVGPEPHPSVRLGDRLG